MSAQPSSPILPLFLILIAGITMSASPLTAQDLVPDARVEIRQCPPPGVQGLCRRWHGAFQSMDGDNLTLRESSGVLNTVAWTPSSRVRVSHGKRGLLVQGAAVGLIVGALVGVSAADSCGGDSEGCGFEVPVMAGMGLVVGSLIGVMARTDRWVTVQRPEPPRGLSFGSVSLKLPTRTTPAGVRLRLQF